MDPCQLSPLQCLNNGTCVMDYLSNMSYCICDECHDGNFCENPFRKQKKYNTKYVFVIISCVGLCISILNNGMSLELFIRSKSIRRTNCGVYLIVYSTLALLSTIFIVSDSIVDNDSSRFSGDQNARGHQGYVGKDGYHRLNILEVQRLIRFMPKAVICVVPGWAVGGGHSLHVTCDLTLASKEHAIFKQTDADVTSFDGGYGSAYLAKMVGQKKAREIFFLGRNYSAQEAFEMGMVNAVIPHADLEATAYEWAQEILAKSPTSIKMLKFAMNLTDDGMVGQQVFAGEATRLAYMTDEAKEGRDAFLEKRKPNFPKKWIP